MFQDRLDLSAKIQHELATTRYACSRLEQLSGGTANFIFHGMLDRPLSDGTDAVVIKHGEDHVASNPNFKLATSRCHREGVLEGIGRLAASAQFELLGARSKAVPLQPRHPHTHVLEYLSGAVNLKMYSLRYFSDDQGLALKKQCLALGTSLGTWLRNFHEWVLLPEQAGLRDIVKSNRAMQSLKNTINYGWLMAAVERFPSILGGSEQVLAEVKAMAEAELRDEAQLQVVHGDFWTGNVLLQPLKEGSQTQIFVIDWEMSQMCVRPVDLGQMVAEMYELFLFKGINAGKRMVEGFAAGYGCVDDEFAFRTIVQVGTHLISFGSSVGGWGTEVHVQQVVATGRDLILKAWHKDQAWFEGGDLACFFDRDSACA